MALGLNTIYHAAYVLRDVARRTDIIKTKCFDCSNEVCIKPENLQLTGSFKLRGAYYKISQLSEEEKSKVIIACSAGNHAQGVALAASRSNINAKIFMPSTAPTAKVEATKSYGADVILVDGTYDDAYSKAKEELEKGQGTFVHPFDDPLVIAGQGTIGLEILDQIDGTDAVVVPIGGGGLISGVAMAVKELKPSCKVIGVQAKGAPSMFNSFKDGKLETLDSVDTFADGIAVKKPGELTFSMVNKYVDDIVVVSEDEVAGAILALMEKERLVAEGAGAVALAATLYDKIGLSGKRVVPIVSGGNIDVNILNRVITRGLVMGGRRATIVIPLIDRPGQLKEIASIVSAHGANVVSVHHDNSDPNMAVNSCFLRVVMETRNMEQVKAIRAAIVESGYQLCYDKIH